MPVELNLQTAAWWAGMILILRLSYCVKIFSRQKTLQPEQHRGEAGKP
jgi:hypothetical protein